MTTTLTSVNIIVAARKYTYQVAYAIIIQTRLINQIYDNDNDNEREFIQRVVINKSRTR